MYTNTNTTARWNKRKTTSNFVYNEDPFAGMNASVDYQKEIERLKQTYKPINKPVISRSTTPDSSSSSDSDISEAAITDEEKARFLAFIRSWTGDWQNTTSTTSSFWSDPLPWNSPIKNQSVSNYPIPVKTHNHHHPLPIGTKRQL